MSFSPPPAFGGHLIYVREDLVNVFAGDRAVVTFGWGERQAHMAWPGDLPDRIRKVYREYRNIWRTHRMVASAAIGSDAAPETALATNEGDIA